jgi:hypothetical protein
MDPVVPDPDEALGRNLAAAYLAYFEGVSLTTARKKYIGEKIGAYWIALAQVVRADMTRMTEERMRGVLDRVDELLNKPVQ